MAEGIGALLVFIFGMVVGYKFLPKIIDKFKRG